MRAIAALNAGSSSVKLAVFDERTLEPIVRESISIESGETHEGAIDRVIERALGALRSRDLDIRAFGHRIVHGGGRDRPCKITDDVLAELRGLAPLAPLHQLHGLAGVAAARRAAPDAIHVACFDTSFHLTAPEVARRYALPVAYRHLVAYGFHGLSYEYIASQLPAGCGRAIAAHLGSGASMCALRDRVSIATTMGMTPLDGLVMSTRCGALDPGVVLYLVEEHGLPPEELRRELYERGGLLGVSGTSGDMKVLLASSDPRAEQAVELFVYRAVRAIGSLAAALGGLDALVFTGGIGEHAEIIRSRIEARSRWLGDFATLVIPTDEELVIARHVACT